ncbi:MAG: CinA family protein [Bacteroides sp.]|nr:CinA family protein [Prevotella sp.]MCM1407618.1 CinA family protein [Treponema brennaborense]MCM1469232.1 CinA family protein [Bacteroides sp.]
MEDFQSIAESTLLEFKKKHWKLACAESCTGGLAAAYITSVPGASDIFSGGVVSYTNEIKHSVLGVGTDTLDKIGAVSEQCVMEMAAGVLRITKADASFAISGIAGPGGGTKEIPVGTVCFGYCIRGNVSAETVLFTGNRENIRHQAVSHALMQIKNKLSDFQFAR